MLSQKPIHSHPLLTDDEYNKVQDILGRAPNPVEIDLFSVLWSEHCSYKSSKVHLKRLPTEGEHVVCGPGENAGIVDIGHGFVAVFKIESHNHPSFIEPFQGAATGVGGILRDIFTMGARPVALLNSLRFGALDHSKNRFLLKQVVSGISAYGNAVGVPTVGGEIRFHEIYTHNPLVNVFCIGIMRREDIVRGQASGAGCSVVYFGSKTGRDGIHGATMASRALDASENARPAVQVGDPFMEKKILEASLELIQAGCVRGMQDMGAGGLSCALSEMAGRGNAGITVDLSAVPLREVGMTPGEILISESQERMLVAVEQGKEHDVDVILKKWDLDFAVVAKVTEDGRFRAMYNGTVVADLPVESLTQHAPVYERPLLQPKFLERMTTLNLDLIPKLSSYSKTLLTLLASPCFSSRQSVYQQFDFMVQTNTIVEPGMGAAVLRMKESPMRLALTVDGNDYALLNPYYGGAIAVAEAARNLVAVGAKPIGMTNCLNFGNPENPETIWFLSLVIEGMRDACLAFNIPVVSGNVSLYNETRGLDIYPTPIIGMVGLLDPSARCILPTFCAEGEVVLLIGETFEELGGSAYLKEIYLQERGTPPILHLDREKAVHNIVLESNDWLSSAQDLSEGGLAVALAKACILSKMGCSIRIPKLPLRTDAILFSESQSRFLVTLHKTNCDTLQERLEAHKIPYTVLGVTGGDALTIQVAGEPVIDLSVQEMEEAYKSDILL